MDPWIFFQSCPDCHLISIAFKIKMIKAFVFVLSMLSFHSCYSEDTLESPLRDPSFLRLLVMHYPHLRAPEPYTYPGPSPPVKPPLRMPSLPEPYAFVPPQQNRLDYNNIPKWCKNMWERDECGMKCWMLRKICRNIAKQTAYLENSDGHPLDSEGSSSIAHPQYNQYVPFYSYYSSKPKPAVTYSKTYLPKTYIAKPSWEYPHLRRASYNYYKNPSHTAEYGLNPQFTYVEGHEKLYTTTDKQVAENITMSTTEATSSTTTSTTETPDKTTVKSKRKGVYPAKVKVISRYPPDSEVTTLSPLMFEYDNLGLKGYYGDRIFMSAVMPVSDRQQRNDYIPSSFTSEEDEMDVFEDFDEMMIDPA